MHKRRTGPDGQAGFSLIELAIAMAIVGILVASALHAFSSYLRVKAQNTTIERTTNVKIALVRFLTQHGRLPCPADPAIGIGQEGAGMENCRPNNVSYPDTACSPSGGLCRILGTRRLLGTPTSPIPPGLAVLPDNERVLRGAVPYATLGLSAREAYDSWGSMLTYAVTEVQASSDLLTLSDPPEPGKIHFGKEYGVIDFKTWIVPEGETDVMAGSDDSTAPDRGSNVRTWMMALVSHGPDRRGGWNSSGNQIVPCTGAGRDIVNCTMNSAVFIEVGDGRGLRIMAPGPLFFDDAIATGDIHLGVDKWQYSGVRDIVSKFPRVAINHEAPAEALDVAGNVRVDRARSEDYCLDFRHNPDGTTPEGIVCLQPKLIGGAVESMSCNGGVMQGVANSRLNCLTSVDTATINTTSCADPSYVVGYCPNGQPRCKIPNTAAPPC